MCHLSTLGGASTPWPRPGERPSWAPLNTDNRVSGKRMIGDERMMFHVGMNLMETWRSMQRSKITHSPTSAGEQTGGKWRKAVRSIIAEDKWSEVSQKLEMTDQRSGLCFFGSDKRVWLSAAPPPPVCFTSFLDHWYQTLSSAEEADPKIPHQLT